MAITIAKLVTAVFIVLLSFIISKIARFILEKAKKVATKTKFELDDRIIEFLERPVSVLSIFLGVFFAIKYISPDLIIYEINLTKPFQVAGILIAAYFTARIFAGILRWYGDEIATKTKSHLDDSIVPFMRRAVYLVVFTIAGIFILNLFGIKLTAVLAGLGIASLAVGLALQDTLSNFFSGIWMAFDRPIKVGDFIEIEPTKTGHVEEISWRNTRIRTLQNNIVIIPNSKLSQNILTNYHAPNSEVGVKAEASVSYDMDLEKVEKITQEVAEKIQKTIKGAVKTFEPTVRYNEFGDSGINFYVMLRAETYPDQFFIKHEFIKQLYKKFKKERIEIPYPQRVIHIKK